MLNFNFYAKSNQSAYCIQVSEQFYEWLIQADFGLVGRSRSTKIILDGEEEELPLVWLENPTRGMLIAYFNDLVLSETKQMLLDLDSGVSRESLAPRQYRMKKLLELLGCVKDSSWQYLQRV
ncbi:MAG: hypothetical protein AAGG51_05235 [Cyanobacteria bacterium P01_G01_bin.54]